MFAAVVQYLPSDGYPAFNIHKDYWMLNNYSDLSKRDAREVVRYLGCKVRITSSAERLQKILSRRVGKKSLIDILERADEDATFPGFILLPAELRVRIYEVHFDSFGAIDAPTQPPVTTASTLLRRKALHLFYQRKKARTFWVQLPAQHLGLITKLRFEDCQRDYVFKLSLGPQQQEAEVKHIKDGNVVHAEQEGVLRKLLRRKLVRPGGKVLQRGDVEVFVRRFDVDGRQGGYDDDSEAEVW